MQRLFLVLAVGVVLFGAPGEARTQQATIGTPAVGLQEGFFERMGTQWGVQGRNWFFQFGGAQQAVPQFGGFQPDAGLSGGFGFGGRDFSGNFNFFGGQGNTRSNTMGTPIVTTMNGAPAYVADTSISPFVIGIIPVVGGGGAPIIGGIPGFARAPGLPAPPMMVPAGPSRVQRFIQEGAPLEPMHGPRPDPGPMPGLGPAQAGLAPLVGVPVPADPSARKLAEARESSAGQAVMSVAAARAAREAEQQSAAGRDARAWFERGLGAEEAGKPNVAVIYYRMAADRADGDLKQQALARLAAIKAAGSAER